MKRILLCIYFCGLIFMACKDKVEQKSIIARFETVDKIVWDTKDKHCRYKPMLIIKDTATDINYIYYWGGRANGGAAICRLWGKPPTNQSTLTSNPADKTGSFTVW